MTARLVVLASGGGTNLQAVLDACADGTLDAQVAAVVSDQPTAFALERARTAGVPAIALPRSEGEPRAQYDARLRDAGAGTEGRQSDDARGVLGVDDCGAAWHRQDEVIQQGPKREVGGLAAGRDDAALGQPDEAVVRDATAVGVELPALGERDGVQPALRIRELDEVADGEGASPVHVGHAGRLPIASLLT